jgi:hypothetical protein
MSLLYFILSGLFLYFLLKLGHKLLLAYAGRKLMKNSVDKWFPLFETGVWVFFAFWGAYVLFGGIVHYDYLIFIMAVLLAIGVSWFFFRDFFAGMIMKSECRLEVGQYIKTPEIEGTIIRLGPRYLELENDSGEKLNIPYSVLNKHWISLPADADKSLSNHFSVRIPDSADPIRLKRLVYEEMMGMPWIVGVSPKLKIHKDKSDQTFLDIRYGLLKEEHALLVEQRIKQILTSSF